ncbi:hypothetical protein NW762_010277 [Fusarium torreyae]|uniref:Uncharacterized protein n=1 Tax=Fusarium torreyae TaxID=1237075 RepID=A0A9W8RTF3_9HYPO|nr:hypothetical protein NW762_010277 [Fusarium torreyae]
MSSERLSTKDYDLGHSPDTESLLSTDESQEKLLPSLPSTTSKRNKSIKAYLHITAIAFYGIITILLCIWTARLNGENCACQRGAIYSPAEIAIQYEKHTIVHNLADNGKYRGPPRPEQDAAWEDLLRYNNLRIQKGDLDKANTTSVPLNDEKGGYLATLDVFHTLHCVNKIRKSYYSDYYHDPNPLADQQEHFDHCIDLLRQVYSCEYQNTVLELGINCVSEKYENIPFFPAPDDAPGACSCNLGKVITSINRAVDELDSCIDRNEKQWDSAKNDNDEMDVFIQACQCCSYSAILSTFWGVCPDTKPSLLGVDDYWYGIISKDEAYPQCADYTDKYSCAGDLKFTPPGKDKSIKFYDPGELPKNGTKTLSNVDGSITSPLSGATFTWTHGEVEHPITVASANAKPTGTTSNNKSGKDDDAKETGSKETGTNNSDGGNSDEASDDEEDTAVVVMPHIWPLAGLVLALLV